MLTISGTINLIPGVTNPRHANVSKVARGILSSNKLSEDFILIYPEPVKPGSGDVKWT